MRSAFIQDNKEFNLGITNNREFTISSRIINDNQIIIDDADFDGVNLTLKATSDRKINNLMIENLVTYARKIYEPDYTSDNRFTIIIPFEDISNFALTKWELKPIDTYKSIKIDNFRFFINNKEIKFHNQRNKVIIDLKNYTIDEYATKQNKLEQNIKLLKKEIKDLKVNKDYLIDENKKLKNKIDAYKSRKSVRIADKLHFK